MDIYNAISGIMSEGYAIGKDKQNIKQGFRYRGIDDVMNTFYPLLAKYHVFVVPEVIDRQREERTTKQGGDLIYSILTIRYTFYAEDGSHVSAVVIGEGMDSGDKASNKAMAVGMKYALFQVFCIPTEEMPDPDADTPEPSVPKWNGPVCSDCGSWIKATGKNGVVTMSAEEVAAKSTEKYGRPLCRECRKKIEAAAEA